MSVNSQLSPDSETQVRTLIAKRGSLKSRLTKFKSFLNNCSTDPTLLCQLELRLTKVQDTWGEFQELQFQLETNTSEDQEAERDLFEDTYYDVVSSAKMMLNNPRERPYSSLSVRSNHLSVLPEDICLNPPQNPDTHTSIHFPDVQQPANPLQCTSTDIRLPKIKLPSFDGTFEAWASFHELYNTLIHSNSSISPIVKFQYLKSSVSGEAAAIIESITLTPENYEVAWSLLLDRFQNKTLIIDKHVRDLFNIAKVEKASPAALNQLISSALKHTRSLKVLGEPVNNWDTILIYLVSSKLDSLTFKEWQVQRSKHEDKSPNFENLVSFLKNRSHILEAINTNIQTSRNTSQVQFRTTNFYKPQVNFTPPRTSSYLSAQPQRHMQTTHQHRNYSTYAPPRCQVCNQPHNISSCSRFLDLSIQDRWEKTKDLDLCTNCLRPGHKANLCRSSRCKICSNMHNSLLCRNSSSRLQPNSHVYKKDPTTSHLASNSATNKEGHVLLSTVYVNIMGDNGLQATVRALLDSGSQSSFISHEVCRRLRLRRNNSTLPITGIGASKSCATSRVEATLKSCSSSFTEKMELIVLPSITGDIPTTSIDVSHLKLPSHITLADPNFHMPSKIDLLIGADLFWRILGQGEVKVPDSNIQLKETQLGWVVVGKVDIAVPKSSLCFLSLINIDKQIRKFWEIEDLSSSELTGDELTCESLFTNTHTRSHVGRYSVELPFKLDPSTLGDSQEGTLRRFYSLERRLSHNKDLHKHYTVFMKEYEQLGHMTQLSDEEMNSTLKGPHYFLPHHPVFKGSSITTKVRVVFDASAKTTSGLSLNDILMVGPAIQETLFSITTRFRTHNIVICGDIEKMYRQVSVHRSHRTFQLIYWREQPDLPLKVYALNTVTYGTGSASFLATRALTQVALDEGEQFPEAASALKNDFYVDDLMSGADTVESARRLVYDLSSLANKGGFHIYKWNSNSQNVLDGIPCEDRLPQTMHSFDKDSHYKTLGLMWDPSNDIFRFSIKNISLSEGITKRKVLSLIAQIFDPLGLLGPVITRAKIFMQRLWTHALQWDDHLTDPLLSEWTQYYSSLSHINNLSIPRQLTSKLKSINLELHGFSDASQAGYGACVYLRSIDTSGSITLRLISSKSRVAPLKSQSIPRLELCGSLLLVTLMQQIKKSLRSNDTSIYYWTDSTIVLNWIASSPSRWETFVRNRVAKIQEHSMSESWRHINGKDNPADLISRGMNGDQILDSDLWWFGPNWLSHTNEFWHSPPRSDIPEIIEPSIALIVQIEDPITKLINKSSYTRIIRTTAYCLRFIQNCQPNTRKQKGPLTPYELDKALLRVIFIIQQNSFITEIKELKKNRCVAKSSKLTSLSPFVDEVGLVRVGGRLQNANFTPDQKTPIVLPHNHRFTGLLIQHEHQRLLHAGPQQVLSSIRQRFWPTNGRSVVRQNIHKCLNCFRAKPKVTTQLMGQLPPARVQPSRPFTHTGIDYCGPFHIKTTSRKNSSTVKAYVSVFVCFATKAVHLELVENLTSVSFLAALRRFTSRRGIPSTIYSDNGTTFVGAHRELKNIRHICNAEDKHHIENYSSNLGITWKWIPVQAPTWGGLWESSVRLVKYHLKRVLGNTSFDFIQFSTLIIEIEACVNSRPLIPLSSDPSDLSSLTPAHFLTGDVLTAIPSPDLSHIPDNRLDKWQKHQTLVQHFWTRWSSQYLLELQQRCKWRTSKPNIKPGTLVIIKEDNLPPTKWRLGRVIQTHPGPDGLVRLVSIRTKDQEVMRAITKVCPLPLQDGLEITPDSMKGNKQDQD